jgi:2'-5' RNA ligase
MKTGLATLPGYQVYEYLVALYPHDALRDRIMQVKKEFYEKFKITGSPGNRVYLGLATFSQYAMMEERIANNLRTVAMAAPPVKVELRNFGSFPSHTIYINVTSKLPVQNLVRAIRTQTQRLMKLDEDRKPHFLMEPHLTIAARLQPWQYEKGWLEFSNRHFTGRFIADGMWLLRRPAGELKYQAIKKFEFQYLPVTTKQGELFD